MKTILNHPKSATAVAARVYVAASLLLLAAASVAGAASVTLTNSDASGNSSFNAIGNWDSGAAPVAGNDYFSSTNTLRTPQDGNDYVFAGNSLTLQTNGSAGGSFLFKGSGYRTYTIANQTNNGSLIRSGSSSVDTCVIAGTNLVLAAGSTNTIQSDQSPFVITAPITGSGNLAVAGTYTVSLNSSNSYTGNTLINGGTLQIGSTIATSTNFAIPTPVLYMSFDQTNGAGIVTNLGSGGTAMNGTILGTGAYITNAGRYGKCLYINGVGGTSGTNLVKISSAVTSLDVVSNWTVAYWLKTTTAGAIGLYQGNGTFNGAHETIFHLNNAAVPVANSTHAGGVRYGGGWLTGTATLNDGKWHFITITCNGSSTSETIYVDGVLDAKTSSFTGTPTGANQVWIGGSTDGDASAVHLNGFIDEVSMFGVTLNQAQVQALMNVGGSGIPQLPPFSPITVASGAKLDLNGYNQTISSLSGAGTVDTTLAAATPTLTISNNGTSTFNGSINNSVSTLSLVKLGTGTQALGGANGYNGSTTVANGALVVTNSGTINANSSSTLLVGSVSGQSAALYQSTGTTVSTTNTGGGGFQIGSTAGAAGYYSISGGTINVGGEIDPGGSGGGAGTFGRFDMSSGTVNLPNAAGTYFLPNRGAVGESSVVNISGGTVQILGGGTPADGTFNGLSINWAGGSQTNATTISGAAQFLTPSLRVKLNQGTSFNGLGVGGANNLTALNLNGGVLQTLGFLNGAIGVNGNVNINFNGGTLKAGTAGNANFLSGIAGAFIYSGGATINDNGVAITNSQALLTPSGNGVSSIAVATGGSGYIVPPQVFITGGGGSNATAYATISGGAVTGITVTSSGNNYSSAPTVTLGGGGYTSAATVGTVSTAANVSGGLTKLGAGSWTLLNSANTYTGNTVVGAGTLFLNGAVSLASGNIVVSNNATFDVSQVTGGFTLANGQSLLGVGTNNGSVNTVSGAKIYAGISTNSYGTNTFNSNLTLVSGAVANFNLVTNYNGANGFINVAGSLTDNGSVSVSAPSTSVNLDTNADYVLITAAGGISGTVSATPLWGTKPLNWRNYTVIQSGNNIQLHYTSSTPPVATGTASPATVVDNQSVLISVTVTPGTGIIDPLTGVVLDGSSIGLGSVPLVNSTGNIYTNTITIPATVLAGPYTLNATITDSTPLTGSTGVGLTVVVTNVIWNGAGSGNFSDNSDWVSTFAPAYVGDSLTFAGTSGLTPNVDQNYTVTGITFSNTAGSFNIGTSGNTLTLTNSSSIVNNSPNAQTLNVPIADNGGGLTYSGSGNLTLAAVNTYTGPTILNGGTLNVSGTVASTNTTTVGNAATNAELIISGSGSLTQNHLFVGNVNGAVGAVYQTGGTVTATAGTGGDLMAVGNVLGGYGYYAALGGSVTANGMAVGGENNTGTGFTATGGNGIMDISGGTVSDTGWFVMARGATNEIGILNVFAGGTLNYAGGGLVTCWGTGQTAIVNILGGLVQNSSSVGFNLNQSGNLTNTSILNLNGGVAQASGFVGSVGGLVNFNGGTLQASIANTSFMSGLAGVNVYSGGATINDNGNNIAINQAFLAPTGNGVTGTLTSGGAGYIAPPIVTVVRGTGDTTGKGASAIAQINPTTGIVTNVIVTSPGVNYTATPTFVVSGGGATSPAVITGGLAANTSGGLTKTGTGTVTLGGLSTYTGNTVINGGTLQLSAPVLHMTFDNVSGTTAGSTVYNQGSGGSTMNGTLTGAATIVSGGRFGNALSIPSGGLTANYVLVSSGVVPFNNSGTWSVGVWVKTSTAGGCYLYQGDGAWASGDTSFYLNSGGTTAGTHAGGVRYGQGWETGTAAVNDGSWHFVVLTCNAGVKAQYVDGALDALTVNQWSGNGTATQLRIGGTADSGDGNVALNGLIDEVYIYNRALSQAEIQSLYNVNNSQVLATNNNVNVASGTFDVGGLAQQISALSGSGNVVLDDVAGAPGTLILGNAGNQEFDGVISDNSGAGALTKVGSGTLLLTGANTFSGATTISNGTILVNGSLSGPVTVTTNGILGGLGTLNGVTTVYGSLIAGSNSVLGTLTFSSNLTLGSGSIAKFSLTTSAGGVNDQAVVHGSLTGNNNVIHISAPSTSVNLDTADYVLIDNSSGSGITGGFLSTPVWDVRPLNYQNYTIQNNGSGQIVLHYSVALPPTATITASPSTVTRNQNSLITVTVTPGSNPILSVTLDTTAIGGSSTFALNQVGASNVYTNTIAVPANYAPGTYAFLATVTDGVSLQGTAGTNLTVTLANDIWTGAGTDANWDTNPNWINSAAPGYFGDSLVFAGTTSLAPSMDQNYTVTSLTFSNNAGSFNIGTSGNTLTLTNSSTIVNNSANGQTVNVPLVFAAAGTVNATAGNLTLANTIDNGGYALTVTGSTNTTITGVVSDTGGLIKTGAGTLSLAASDTFTGNTIIRAGTLTVPAAGAIAPTGLISVSDTTGNNAVVNVNGGTFNAADNPGQFSSSLVVGSATNSAGDLQLASGTLSVRQQLALGTGVGGSAALDISGGTATIASFLVVGFNNDRSVLNQSGGSLAITNNLMTIAAGGSAAVGVVNLSGGTFSSTATTGYGPTIGGTFVGEFGTGTLNVSGTASLSLSGWGLRLGQNGGANGTVNLLGGTISTVSVSQGGGAGLFNFNGGTLQARTNNTLFIPNLNNAYVYGGGAKIDDGGHAITIAQALLAPTGYGVSSITLSSGGTGYISTPIVTITGGSGSGASAVALINPNTGVVTNITVVNPGSGYASSDTLTVAFSGGGGSGATASAPALTANTSGGLTKLGSGTLTLTGSSTYTGNTTISNGTLALGAGGSISNSANINVTSGTIFDVSVTGFSVNSGQTLEGNGTVNGSMTNNGTVLAGVSGSLGTLTFNNNLTLQSSGTTSVKLNKTFSPAATNDTIIVTGAANYGGTLAVNNLAGTLALGDQFKLFSAGTYAGNFTSISGSPGTGLAYNFNPSSGVLSVVTGVVSYPTNITATVSGSTLAISWPSTHLGWILQAQTNSLSTGLGTNWVDVPNTASVTSTNETVNPASPAVFYRLRHP